jgi:8-oxo-dGTP pyrophosphatase MutT (NUDIX family)
MEPRPAATVILARPDPSGVQVLVLERGEGNRFAPGFAVFPGGAIEPADAELAASLFADPSESARACALRELHEEAGILLTSAGPVTHPHDGPLAAASFEPPSLEMLPEIARWIAPDFLEKRFDARFFAAAAPEGLRAVADRVEIAEARWVRPATVVEAWERGSTKLMWPTIVTLRALAGCADVAEVLDLRVEQVPGPRELA